MAKAKLQFHSRAVWDKSRGASKRAWRLYGTAADGKHGGLPSRCFSDEIRAHNAAMIDVRWGKFKTIEVYDVRSGLESGTHKMLHNGQIDFSVPRDGNFLKLLHKLGVNVNGIEK